MVVALLLGASAAMTGALAGFAAGVVAAPLDGRAAPRLGVIALIAMVAAVVLDLFVPPLSVRRQVPQLWGRIFRPRTTAVLYGSRLGVGPLTILRTWWWWSALVLGALAGVWWSVAVGALYGSARVVAMLAVGTDAGSLRRRTERIATVTGVVVAGGALALAALGQSSSGVLARSTSERASGEARSASRPSDRAVTTTTPAPGAIVDTGLGSLLPDELGAGMTRMPDAQRDGLGPLDLAAAVAAEEDPQAERSLLETRHFEAGHARAWRTGDGRLAYAAVYRFRDDASAGAYLGDGFITLASRGAQVYDVADPAGGRGFSQAGSDASGSHVSHGVAFVRGNRFFLVFESARTSAATRDDAAAVARSVDAWQASRA